MSNYYNFLKYCREIEKVENYKEAEKDNFEGWVVHHRYETETSDGEPRSQELLSDELKALDMYYDRPASELIFMRRSEHRSIHNACIYNSVKSRKGKHLTEEHKAKIVRYGSENHNSKKVICLETGQIFESALAASKQLGAKTNCVSMAIRRGKKSYGYTYKFLEEK